jgi:uncharacterized membrane protein YjdF
MGEKNETVHHSHVREYQRHILVLIFTLFYLILFTAIAMIRNNYEFIFYSLILSVMIVVVMHIHNRFYLPALVMIGLSVGGLLHFMGGSIVIGGTRLYDITLIRFVQYDNFVHLFNSFVATFVFYNLLARHFMKRLVHERALFSLILILIVSGLGAMNEIVEFGAVLFLDAAETVGGYYNNSIDLVYNLIGAIGASWFINWYHKRHVQAPHSVTH